MLQSQSITFKDICILLVSDICPKIRINSLIGLNNYMNNGNQNAKVIQDEMVRFDRIIDPTYTGGPDYPGGFGQGRACRVQE